ncbi:MAG: alpha/beta fold hydrolase [Acidobacteria bacterium]|nr:alpha/beta fold hydrolase [Acidobacteriota bacterium]
MRNTATLLWAALTLCAAAAQDPTAARRATLEELQQILLPSRAPANGRINAQDKTWEDWVRRTGELPPDFDALPSVAELPDPLMLDEGGRRVPVTTPEQWARKKRWIREQVERWVFGSMPPAPDNLRATVKGSHREGTATVRDVLLEFGPGRRATLRLQLVIPDGRGPFPVFLTNHGRNRPWLYTAVNRGYIACYYYATDPNYGDDDDSDRFIEVYPGYDFSCLARWAWAASRAVDYLYTLPEADKGKIGLTGHSRNGKQALLAAAFDERIGAVIPSSGNTGEIIPWRYNTNPFAIESLELLTGAQSHWFHPRLHFFAGRENKLPVDQHMLLAMVAPRGLMMYSGYAESAANPLGFEQAYRSALRVYRFLGREENIWLHLREGEHATSADDIENFVDFYDAVFGRGRRPKSETWINGYEFDSWSKRTGEKIDPLQFPERSPGNLASGWERRKPEIRQAIRQMLGAEPPRLPFAGKRKLTDASWSNESWLATLYNRPTAERHWQDRLRAAGMGVSIVPFGDGLAGQLFYPVDASGKPRPGKWPAVVWLHPYAYSTGWSARSPWNPSATNYLADQRPSFASLAGRGFAVLAFDQIGFGTRLHEARRFYERYPGWSLMGRMVADTRDAVDALAGLEEIDASRISLVGYSLGAKVALFAAAADERIRAVAAVCGVEALRLDRPEKGAEGLRHYSHLHGLIPRFGFFLGRESRLPVDYDELLALAAPRPVLVVAPIRDRYAPVEDVRRVVEASRGVYRQLGREEALELDTPADINRFSRKTQERVFDWLARVR